MDKRSDISDASEYIEKEEKKVIKRSYVKKSQPQTVKLRLLKNLKVNAIGDKTGKRYSWAGGGAVVDVDILDKDKLLQKTGNPVTCCKDVVREPYFELVE